MSASSTGSSCPARIGCQLEVDEWAFALTHPQSDLTTTVSQVIVSPVYVAK